MVDTARILFARVQFYRTLVGMPADSALLPFVGSELRLLSIHYFKNCNVMASSRLDRIPALAVNSVPTTDAGLSHTPTTLYVPHTTAGIAEWR